MRWHTTTTQIPAGNRGNKRTLRAMYELAQRASHDPVVIQAAHDIVRRVPERDDLATFRAVLEDVRNRMRYTHDPLGAELVKDPAYVIGMSDVWSNDREPMDCDDASTLTASLLGALGYETKFVTVAVDRSRPDEWSHVYVAARSGSQWVPIDPIVREFAVGDQVPDFDLTAPRAYHAGVSPMRMNGMGEGAEFGWDQALTSISNVFQKKADAKLIAAQAKLAAANRPAAGRGAREGFFTDANGETKWANVAMVAAAAIVGVVLLKKMK